MWSSNYLRQCRKARHSRRCSHTCHRRRSSQSDSRGRTIRFDPGLAELPASDHGGTLTSCLSRSGHRSWGPNLSTSSRCSATQQKRSLGRCKCHSTGLVTDISKNSLILRLCWRWRNMQLVGMDPRRQSPKTLWPRRRWPRSKRACTWRRATACELKCCAFSTRRLPVQWVSTMNQKVVLKIRPQLGTRGSRACDDVQRPRWQVEQRETDLSTWVRDVDQINSRRSIEAHSAA